MTDKSIPLFDVEAQHAFLNNDLEKAVRRVLRSCHYILGEEGAEFEKEFAETIGTRFAEGLSSGTSALHLAVQALDVGRGAGVLTVPFTFIGTTIGILSAGAEVQFCDIDPVTLTMDPADAERRVRKNTKVLLPVHLYGYPADMPALLRISKRRRLRIIEDCAQSHLASIGGRKVGGFGDIGCFSFYVSKNLGAAGDAGACVTNRAELDQRIRILRNNGSDPKKRYKHVALGTNARLDEIQAAVLRVKLRQLRRWTAERTKRADVYRERLKDVPLALPPADGARGAHVYHLFVVRTRERDRLKEFLAQGGVSTGVYYPIPLHLQPAYRHFGYRRGDFPVSEQASREVLALPLYPELPLEKIARIADRIRLFFRRGRP